MTAADVTVLQLETASLGNRSYLIVTGSGAIAVDPPRDIDRVEALLDEHDVPLKLVVETHLHADYVSGGLELSRQHGAAYAVPGEVAFAHTPVSGGTELSAAGVVLRAVHTPGHTPHHLAYVLDVDGRHTAVFTGGSMLFGAVGRTDLISPELTVPLSGDQWRSVRHLAETVAPQAEVLPTHGFGSFCSATPTIGTASTVGQQRQANPACTTELDSFVATLLAGYDAYPAYYARLPRRNADGPAPVDLSVPSPAEPGQLLHRRAAGEWLLDLRPRAAFAESHLTGSYNFDGTGPLAVYVGWLLPAGAQVVLLGAELDQVRQAQRELVRIGLDRPAAIAVGTPEEWAAGAEPVRRYRRASFADLPPTRVDGGIVVLDTRRQSEWADGHLADALHVPLHELPARLDEVPADREVWVHCASGFRASIAASLLDAAGRTVVLLDDDFESAGTSGHPVVSATSVD